MKQPTKLERQYNTLKTLLNSEIYHLQKLKDTDNYDKIIEWSQALIETVYTIKKIKYMKIITQLEKTE